ncbi:MAG: DNA adenine methylase [Bacteroidetes bacterium]|nr:DNA adenine methylase [Bacteroidota bacterium]
MLLRDKYNSRQEDNFYHDMVLYVLIVFGFNNQMRFNKSGEFNLPVGKRDFNSRMREKLINFIDRIQSNNYEFIAKDFSNIKAQNIEKSTFVYADPPYLITTASYNEQGKWNGIEYSRIVEG